jgi:hypothetical protein
VNVRLATLDDIEALISLRIQLLEADPGWGDALRAWLRMHFADGSFLAWVADDAGTGWRPAGSRCSTAHPIQATRPSSMAT